MKKIIFSIILFFVCSFTSKVYASDDHPLKGTWKFDEVRVEVKASTPELKAELEMVIIGLMLDGGLGDVLVFGNNAVNSIISSNQETETLPYTMKGDEVMIVNDAWQDALILQIAGNEIHNRRDMLPYIDINQIAYKSEGKVEEIQLVSVWKKSKKAYPLPGDWLHGHPIVGRWCLEDFVYRVDSENKDFADLVNAKFQEQIFAAMKPLIGTIRTYTEWGRILELRQIDEGTEINRGISYVENYNIYDNKLLIDNGDYSPIAECEYEVTEDSLFLYFMRGEVLKNERYMLDNLQVVWGEEIPPFSFDLSTSFSRMDANFTALKDHPITQGKWVYKDMYYNVETEDDKNVEEARNHSMECFGYYMDFWKRTGTFDEKGWLNLEGRDPADYCILDYHTLEVYTHDEQFFSVQFRIEGDLLYVEFDDLKSEVNTFAALNDFKSEITKVELSLVFNRINQ